MFAQKPFIDSTGLSASVSNFQQGMAEAPRSAEIETSCDVTIAIQSDRTSKEQKILRVPCQLIEGMAEAPRSAEIETSCGVTIAIQSDRTSKEQKILRVPCQLIEGMAEVSQSAEIETSCDVTIAIQSDRTSKEQKILRVPCQLIEGMEEVSQLAKTETNCHVSIAIQKDRPSIGQKLNLDWKKPKQKILRVPHQLFKVNEKAYEPYVISIGPYHRGKDHLKEMEGQKVQSLKWLLQRNTYQSVETYLSEIRNMEKEIRNCYSEPLDISKEEFVEMMVLDGCFIIQFFTKNLGDSFCYSGLIYSSILHDLVLVENQLPFFVLLKLLNIISSKFPTVVFNMVGVTDPRSHFIRKVLKKFKKDMPGLTVDRTYNDDSIQEVEHLVHLLHSNWRPSKEATDEYDKQTKDWKWHFMIPSATELREAGIEFQVVETEGDNVKRSLFDIKFKNGKLEMPAVTIEDGTESLYRNLIACEQFDNSEPRYLTEYVKLMDCLINSGKDVELLCKKEIIVNFLGDHETVAILFNRLGDHTNLSKKNFFYAQLFKDVHKHYKTPWNKRKANLRHNYFNTPWAFISFLAATLLLLLTVLQTSFTIFYPS
ncbi:hypothetical protein SLEP1_g12289 [Rubroshorea leprosula]|uniref:Uncharacterized protein n=1 Tax=Rubroshorea leprosula TaxID=152421 RepID=A0AAV5IC18_9ROSI|nr:hypothetical protein SLEP1_g12289 [Rubroshorea leprosula]